MAEFSDRNSCDALKSVGERSELSRRDSQFCGEISKVDIPLNMVAVSLCVIYSMLYPVS